MLIDGNRTSHTYNEKIAAEILDNIDKKHLTLLTELEMKFNQLLKIPD